MTNKQRRAAATALAEAIPHALRGNAWMVVHELQAVMVELGLDKLDDSENAFAAARRGEANLNTPDPNG